MIGRKLILSFVLIMASLILCCALLSRSKKYCLVLVKNRLIGSEIGVAYKSIPTIIKQFVASGILIVSAT